MRNKMMALAMVILIAMLAFPIYVLVESWTEDVGRLGSQPLPLDQTGLSSYYNDIAARHQLLLVILAITEVVLLIIFTLVFRAALKP